MKTIVGRVLAILLMVSAILIGLTPAANAAVASALTVQAAPVALESGTTGEVSACSTDTDGFGANGNNNLPVTRWVGATSDMHKLMLSQDHMGNILNSAQRDLLVGSGMSAGNTMWGIGASMTSFAINLCMLDSFGGAADRIASTIGNAMMNSGLLTLLVVAALIATVWKGATKNGSINWRPLLSKVVILGVLGAMISGAMASTGGGADGSDNNFSPGIASPGWIVSKLNTVIGSLASAPAAALSGGANGEDVYTSGSNGTANATLSCDRYLWSMKDNYQNMYGNAAMQMNAGVPLILSNMWENTGLFTWRTAQFGTTETSTLDNASWCRLLEWKSGQQTTNATSDEEYLSTSVRAHIIGSIGAGAPSATSPVWNGNAFAPNGDEQIDRSVIAWSACALSEGADPAQASSWTINPAYTDADTKSKLKDGDGPAACATWWGASEDDSRAKIKEFEWPTTSDQVNERTEDRDLRQFINTLHGSSNGQGIVAVNTYVIAAIAMLLAFGSISVALLLAKAAMIMMIVFAFIMMITTLLPNADSSKLMGAIKSLLGIILYVFLIQLLFAIIAMITRILQEAGDAFMEKGDPIYLLWTGLSPLAAIILIHFVFTKIMKLPSPFSIAGGLAWGGLAAGAGGAALAGAAGLMSRGRRRASGAAGRGMRRAGGAGINKVRSSLGLPGSAGQNGPRRGAAAPLGPDGKPVAGKGTKGKLGDQQTSETQGGRKNSGDPSTEGGTKRKNSAGQIDTEDLSSTSLRNSELGKGAESQLGDGHMSRAERRALKDAARREREEAESFQDDERARMGLPPIDRSRKGRRRLAAAQRMASARNAILHHPIRTAGKVIGKSAKYAAIGTGLLAVSAFAPPLAGALLAGYGAKKVTGMALKKRRNNRARMDNVVESYRQGRRVAGQSQKAPATNGQTPPEEVLKAAGEANEAAEPKPKPEESVETTDCSKCGDPIPAGQPHDCSASEGGGGSNQRADSQCNKCRAFFYSGASHTCEESNEDTSQQAVRQCGQCGELYGVGTGLHTCSRGGSQSRPETASMPIVDGSQREGGGRREGSRVEQYDIPGTTTHGAPRSEAESDNLTPEEKMAAHHARVYEERAAAQGGMASDFQQQSPEGAYLDKEPVASSGGSPRPSRPATESGPSRIDEVKVASGPNAGGKPARNGSTDEEPAAAKKKPRRLSRHEQMEARNHAINNETHDERAKRFDASSKERDAYQEGEDVKNAALDDKKFQKNEAELQRMGQITPSPNWSDKKKKAFEDRKSHLEHDQKAIQKEGAFREADRVERAQRAASREKHAAERAQRAAGGQSRVDEVQASSGPNTSGNPSRSGSTGAPSGAPKTEQQYASEAKQQDAQRESRAGQEAREYLRQWNEENSQQGSGSPSRVDQVSSPRAGGSPTGAPREGTAQGQRPAAEPRVESVHPGASTPAAQRPASEARRQSSADNPSRVQPAKPTHAPDSTPVPHKTAANTPPRQTSEPRVESVQPGASTPAAQRPAPETRRQSSADKPTQAPAAPRQDANSAARPASEPRRKTPADAPSRVKPVAPTEAPAQRPSKSVSEPRRKPPTDAPSRVQPAQPAEAPATSQGAPRPSSTGGSGKRPGTPPRRGTPPGDTPSKDAPSRVQPTETARR